LAILLYGLLWLKKKITGQTVIFLVVDLPIEQSLNFNLPIRASIRLFNAFEGFAFRAADRIV
jgi:hypothetical protein